MPPLRDYVEPIAQPSIEEKGMMTIRLHRLHLSSRPCPHTLAISWPHSQRVSRAWSCSSEGAFEIAINMRRSRMKMRTILNILVCVSLSTSIFNRCKDSFGACKVLIIPHEDKLRRSLRFSWERGCGVARANCSLWSIRLRLQGRNLVVGRVTTVLTSETSRRHLQ